MSDGIKERKGEEKRKKRNNSLELQFYYFVKEILLINQFTGKIGTINKTIEIFRILVYCLHRLGYDRMEIVKSRLNELRNKEIA